MRKNLVILISLLFICLSLNAQDKPVRWSEPTPSWAFDLRNNVNHTPFQPIVEQPVNQTNSPVYYNSPTGVFAVNPSFRVLPRANSWQSEVILVRNPVNPNIMFGSSNAFNAVGSLFISEGVYVTTNGGASWYGSDTCTGAPISNHGGDPGPTIDKNGTIIMTHLGYSTSGMFGNYSTDNGLTWSANYTIMAGGVDKNFAGTDDSPTSPFYGRSYCVWTQWSGTYDANISYTTNGGVSWSTPTVIIPSTGGRINRAEDIRTSTNGQVNVCWTPTNGSSSEDYCAFAKSTNGGVTFTGTQTAFAMSGLMCFNNCFLPYNIRMNSFPRIDVDRSGGPRNGWIYIVVSQKNLAPAGTDPDIVLHRSTDNGATWSAGIRVNQDPINNGKQQFYNAIRVDEMGGINVVYYDNRNTSADSAECFVSRSVDGGTTWLDMPVSGHRFKPKPITVGGIAGGYAGDYIGITSGNNKVWPFWCDDITGVYQAWTASIDLGPAIVHTPLGTTEQTTGTRTVNCSIIPAGSGINPSTAQLKYAKNSTTWTTVQLTNSSGTNWTANITLSGAGTYNYYLTATDSLARVATAPGGAPANYYSFIASTDTVKPVITHTPILPTPKLAWPTTVTCTVTDNIGVDSAWVNWKKGAVGVAKRFKLTNTSGSTYSALFNSINSDVVAGDTIFYRIIAQDNSSGHNKDSTSLNNFKIIAQATACIGTGTIQMGSASGPFNTYWYGNRTQFLYTATEIIANQGGPGYIARIGFDIAAVGGQAMSGFNINIQHTALTTMSGFVTTGWTNVYTGTYTVPGTGWQYIDLQVPFNYNGTSNLLVEVCFGNASYTTATTVNGTTMSGMEYSEYHDISTACTTFLAPTAQTARANTCFVINTVNSVNSNINSVPTTYSLSQNYPNPFNPVTRINFSIPKQGFVYLKIYDVLGREVKTLVNEVKTPGAYTVDFNGSELSSGVYFYKLESNGFSDVKKLMLVK